MACMDYMDPDVRCPKRLLNRSPPGPIWEIEGFVTHICVTRGMRAAFHDAHMRHQATMSYKLTQNDLHERYSLHIYSDQICIYICFLCIRNMWFTGICNEDLLQFSHRISLCFIVCVYQRSLQTLVAICRHMAIFFMFSPNWPPGKYIRVLSIISNT